MSLQPPPIEQKPIGLNGQFDWPWVHWFQKIKEIQTESSLDFLGDTGTGSIDLPSQDFSILGTSGEIDTAASSQTLTIGLNSAITTSIETNTTNIAINAANISDNEDAIAALDLDFAGDTGTGTVSDAQTFTLSGTTSEIETSATDQTLTIGLPSEVVITTSLGIGTSTPDGTAHVHTATAGSVTANTGADDLVVENSASTGVSILSPDASNSRVAFGSPSDNIGAQVLWDYGTSGANKLFKIQTATSGGELVLSTGDVVEAVRIDSSGNVGIGATTPASILEVAGDITINETDGGFVTWQKAGVAIGLVGNAADLIVGADTDFGIRATNNMRFSIGTSEKMTLLSSGNVGIGTAAPSSLLDLQSTGAINLDLHVDTDNNSTSDAAFRIFNNGGATATWNFGMDDSDSDIFKWAYNSNVLSSGALVSLKTSGEFGVGTTNPTSIGHFVSAEPILHVQSNGTSQTASLKLTGTDGADTLITSAHASSSLKFQTNSTTAVTIDSGGNVGIGITSTSEKLDVRGNLHVLAADGVRVGNAVAEFFNEELTDGHNFGMVINAGSTATDFALFVQDHDASNNLFIIEGGGDVGIGTALPSSSSFASGFRYLTVESTTSLKSGAIELYGNGNDTDDVTLGSIIFGDNSNTAGTDSIIATMQAETVGTSSTDGGGKLHFQTKPDAGTLAIALTIEGDGHVEAANSLDVAKEFSTTSTTQNISSDNVNLNTDVTSFLLVTTSTTADPTSYTVGMKAGVIDGQRVTILVEEDTGDGPDAFEINDTVGSSANIHLKTFAASLPLLMGDLSGGVLSATFIWNDNDSTWYET